MPRCREYHLGAITVWPGTHDLALFSFTPLMTPSQKQPHKIRARSDTPFRSIPIIVHSLRILSVQNPTQNLWARSDYLFGRYPHCRSPPYRPQTPETIQNKYEADQTLHSEVPLLWFTPRHHARPCTTKISQSITCVVTLVALLLIFNYLLFRPRPTWHTQTKIQT